MSDQSVGSHADSDVIQYRGVALPRDGSVLTDAILPFIADGTYELAETLVLRRTLAPSDVVLELGTGLGYLAVQCCRLIGDAAVHTVEANPWLVPYIRRTFALNGVAPSFENCVLGRDAGVARFHVHRDFWASSELPVDGARTIEVERRSFACILDAIQPTYLLVDIEGGEVELFRNAVPEGVQKICIEFHPEQTGNTGVSEVVTRILAQGFELDLDKSEKMVLFFRRSGQQTSK